jgi:hypothetical protein
MMNSNIFGKSRSWPSRGLLEHTWRDWDNPRNLSEDIRSFRQDSNPGAPEYRFQILAAMVMMCSSFRNITPFSPVKVNGLFGGTCHLPHVGSVIDLCFSPGDGAN